MWTVEPLALTFGDQPEAWRRLADKVALRSPDPDAGRDAAGRVIPHDFVVLEPWADKINSLEEDRQLIWSLVAEEFKDAWERTAPPPRCGNFSRRSLAVPVTEAPLPHPIDVPSRLTISNFQLASKIGRQFARRCIGG